MEAGKRHALIVATQEYRDPGLRKLRAPARDAEDLARTLRDPQIGNFEVDTVVNAPSSTVRRRVQQFLAGASVDTLLFLYFSCHGLKDDAGNLFLATHDTEVDLAEATSVESSLINRHVHRSRAKRIVVVLDCCYSGAFGRELTAKASDRVGVEDLLDLGRGRMWMTSSNSMEYSFEGSDHEHGERSGLVERSVFTRAVVEGLQTGDADRDRDGYVSFDELYQYVFERVQDETPNQHPTRGGALEGPVYIARNPAFRGPAPGPPGSGTGPASPVSRTLPRLNAELQPTASTCRRIARHALSVENQGPLKQTVACTASSDEACLAVGVVAAGSDQPLLGRALTWLRGVPHEGSSASLSTEPGKTAELQVVVAVRGWRLHGPAAEHPFQVVVTADRAPPATVEGRVLQLPLVAHPVRVLLAALMALPLGMLIVLLSLTASVPGVYRQPETLALAHLRSAGFNPVVERRASDKVESGLVISISPHAYTRHRTHSVVKVRVSSGPDPSPTNLKALAALPESLSLAVGQTATITLTGTMTDGTPAPPGAFAATWASSRPDVASVVSGTVKAEAPGTGTVTASVGTLTASVAVTVSKTTPPDPGPLGHTPPISSPTTEIPSPTTEIPSPTPTTPPAVRPLAATDKVFSGGDGVIYAVTTSGQLIWYRQTDPQGGAASFAPGSGKPVGSGLSGYTKIFSGGGGVIYAIDAQANLFLYRHNDPMGGTEGLTRNPAPIGIGWNFSHVFSGGDGVIYAIDAAGNLRWYRYNDLTSWAPGSSTIIGSWNFSQVFSGGGGIAGNAGVIYALDAGGKLFWDRYKDPAGGSKGFVNDHATVIDSGFNYPQVFSGGGGVIYAVDKDGKLLWYRHDDPAGGAPVFANSGVAKQILP